jgi:hypothetical protein
MRTVVRPDVTRRTASAHYASNDISFSAKTISPLNRDDQDDSCAVAGSGGR